MRRLIWAVFLLPLIALSQPKTKYSENTRKAFERDYDHCRITLHTTKASYIAGQDIYIEYQIKCNPARVRPWSNFDVIGFSRIFRDGEEEETWPRSNDLRPGGAPGTQFDGSFQANGSFFSKGSWDLAGFHYLFPGHYTAWMDAGIISPEYSFTIEPIPDSLQSRWTQYSLIKRLFAHFDFRNGRRQDIDDAHDLVSPFIPLPAGSIFRKEALEAGLDMYGLYRAAGNYYSFTDSTFARLLIDNLELEVDCPPETIVILAGNSICQGENLAETAVLFRAFADQVRRDDVATQARVMAQYSDSIHVLRNLRESR
jgi:hypothetical protein